MVDETARYDIEYYLFDGLEESCYGDAIIGSKLGTLEAHTMAAAFALAHVMDFQAVIHRTPVGLQSISYRLSYPDGTTGYVVLMSERDRVRLGYTVPLHMALYVED